MGLLSSIFKRRAQPQRVKQAQLLTGGAASFAPFCGNAYESDTYRSAVDAIARNVAKLKPQHVVSMNGSVRKAADAGINAVLQTRWNPFTSTYDGLYRMATHYYLFNNAFAWLQMEGRRLIGIWPIFSTSMEFVEDGAGVLYCRFRFSNGMERILPYAEIIHLRRHYNSNELLGDSNTAILPGLSLAHTQTEGMQEAIKSGAQLRGLLKYTQIMAPEQLKEEKAAFVKEYLQISNNGGIAVIDQKTDFVPLKMEPIAIDDKQLAAVETKIYKYLGLSEKIVGSTYNEDEWAAFYESVIEPLAVQLSLEFTAKVFTQRERSFGNSILFEANRLQFASTESKVKLLAELMPLGMLTINQGLEILNLPSIPDGDKRLQTLNVVDAAKANQYQLGERAPSGKVEASREVETDKGAPDTGGQTHE